MKTITAQQARALIRFHSVICLNFSLYGKRRMIRIRNKAEALALLKGVAPGTQVAVECDNYNRVIIHADAPAQKL